MNKVWFKFLFAFAAFNFASYEAHCEGRNILTASDLNEESPHFKEGSVRWHCFTKQNLKYSCSFVKPLDQQGSSIGFDISDVSASHFYSHSHAISGEVCKSLLAELKRILKKHQHFCILGTLDEIKKNKPKDEYFWSFYRLKTAGGYIHYRRL